MVEKFHNPYHFVPLGDAVSTPSEFIDDSWESKEKIGRVGKGPLTFRNLGPASFDRYHRGTFSGKIICRLTTEGPVVIGGTQEPAEGDQPGVVHPFKIDDKPAIPASTLRGCISSIAEAASNSAMRVLDKSPYSRRASLPAREALSAMGMIVKREGLTLLKPLALPMVEKNRKTNAFDIPGNYRDIFPEPRHKGYCFEKHQLPVSHTTWTLDNPTFYWARIGSFIDKAGRFRIGQCVSDLKTNEPDNPTDYVRGILRVMHTKKRIEEMPPTKKHELFIPFTEKMEKDDSDLVEIPQDALDRFHRLAEKAAEDNERRKNKGNDLLPFVPKGARALERRRKPFRLMAGDIVFFEANAAGRIHKLSLSQIWREELADKAGKPITAHSFVQNLDPELLPFHKNRKTITPAEMLFGFVQDELGESNQEAKALKGRVRFTEAHMVSSHEDGPYIVSDDATDQWPVLRILSSPKPPCPTLYFRKKQLRSEAGAKECYVSKTELSPKSHQVQGRKFYLHHRDQKQFKTGYPTEDTAQKNRVRPLAKGCEFLFAIDYENLTAAELGLLAYALSPTEGFRLKIGMGKPLGLGSARLEVVGSMEIDRVARYSSTHFLSGERYQNIWVDPGCLENLKQWQPNLARLIDKAELLQTSPLEKHVQAFFDATPGLDSVRQALVRVGSTQLNNVFYPHQKDPEKELFKWFVQNDLPLNKEKNKQGLVPLDVFNGQKNEMPALQQHRPGNPHGQRGKGYKGKGQKRR